MLKCYGYFFLNMSERGIEYVNRKGVLWWQNITLIATIDNKKVCLKFQNLSILSKLLLPFLYSKGNIRTCWIQNGEQYIKYYIIYKLYYVEQ